jgi:DNA-binding NarL/FixJ family response regulator
VSAKTPKDWTGPVLLNPRQQQIADLLLQGCGNAEIAKLIKMKRRTVKAHFNRLFRRFGIRSGIKRVKLATLFYRSQLLVEDAADNLLPTKEGCGPLPK